MNIKALSLATLAALSTAVAFAPSASAQYYGGGYGFNNSVQNGYGSSTSYTPSRRSRPSVGSNSYYNNQAQSRYSSSSSCSSYSFSSYC